VAVVSADGSESHPRLDLRQRLIPQIPHPKVQQTETIERTTGFGPAPIYDVLSKQVVAGSNPVARSFVGP